MQAPSPWSDPAFLALGPVDRHSALQYFARSPFYDERCLNEAGGSAGLAYVLRPPRREEEEGGLFIIEARQRTPGLGDVVLSAFAILQGSVVAAPSLRELVQTRAARAAEHVRGAVEALRALDAADVPATVLFGSPSSRVATGPLTLLPPERVNAITTAIASELRIQA